MKGSKMCRLCKKPFEMFHGLQRKCLDCKHCDKYHYPNTEEQKIKLREYNRIKKQESRKRIMEQIDFNLTPSK